MYNAKILLKYFLIAVNIVLTAFFAGAYYIAIGLVLAAFSAVACIFCRNNKVGYFLIYSQVKSYNRELLDNKEERNPLLITVAFLILSMKIGGGIALIVEGGAIILLAFCILIASGWFIEGRASGMSVGLAYSIAKIIMKIYLFLTSLIDKIAMAIVRIEFSILKIEEQ